MFNLNQPNRGFWSGAFLGGTIGAITAFLFASSKGKKIRKEFMDKFQEFGSLMTDFRLPSPVAKKSSSKKKRKKRRK